MKKKKISIWSSIKGYWLPTILAPLTIALEVVMEIIIPLVMADMLNIIKDKNAKVDYLTFISTSSQQRFIIYATLILILLSILSLLFGFLSGMFSAKASCGFAKNLRKNIFYKLQEYSFENIDKFQTSSLITRATTDVQNVQGSFQMVIRIAVRSPFMLIFAFIMAFRINPYISQVYLVAIPFLAIGLFTIMKLAHPNFKTMFKKYDRLNTVVQENVAGQRTVKAFVRKDEEIDKFKEASKDIYKYATNAEKILAFSSPILQFAVNCCFMFISFVGAELIVKSNLPLASQFDVGKLNALFTYNMQILMSLNMVSMIIIMLTISKASRVRIREILNEDPTIKNSENPIYDMKDGSISFENVGFSYTNDLGNLVLENINIKIESGQTVGIVGGTGSAKSTFVNLIPRLYDVTEGSIKIGGIDVKDYDIKYLRDQVSVVLQKNVLFSGTVSSNLRWGDLDASDEEIIKAAKLAQADEFVSQFSDGYESRIEQGGSNVSGGQRQRLCIARALVKKPKILILDDSTSAVDTKTDALIQKAFKEEIPLTTKIIIAQRISSVSECDMIIVLDDGKINGVGTHEELLETNSIYKEVYTSQVKGVGSSE